MNLKGKKNCIGTFAGECPTKSKIDDVPHYSRCKACAKVEHRHKNQLRDRERQRRKKLGLPPLALRGNKRIDRAKKETEDVKLYTGPGAKVSHAYVSRQIQLAANYCL